MKAKESVGPIFPAVGQSNLPRSEIPEEEMVGNQSAQHNNLCNIDANSTWLFYLNYRGLYRGNHPHLGNSLL